MTAQFENLEAAQKGMADAITRLEGLRDGVALAKQIVEFSNDRCKSALSKLVVEYQLQQTHRQLQTTRNSLQLLGTRSIAIGNKDHNL